MSAQLVDAPPAQPRPRLHWWREVTYVAVFYVVYSAVRNTFGSAAVSPAAAFDNAMIIIDVERALGLYVEETVQAAFLPWTWWIRSWNVFYGTFHFAVTGGVMVWLFFRHPARYLRWRTTLAVTTGLALLGFAVFPLMPPRLLSTVDPSFDYVDTLRTVGGWWSFDSNAMRSISNQYAAMPSLHFAWSAWSAGALLPVVRAPWRRALIAAYPACTVDAIVVTGNHFWLDAVGGGLVLAVGYVVAHAWYARVPPRRIPDPGTASP